MKSPYDINNHFENASLVATYKAPTREAPYHRLYLAEDTENTLEPMEFDLDQAALDQFKDGQRITVTLHKKCEDIPPYFTFAALS